MDRTNHFRIAFRDSEIIFNPLLGSAIREEETGGTSSAVKTYTENVYTESGFLNN